MRVRAHTLERLAGLIWLGVGVMLLYRGGEMLFARSPAGPWTLTAALAGGLVLGALKGHFVLAYSASSNRRRIRSLREPRLWHLFPLKLALLIPLMVALGIGLRSMAAADVLGWALVGAIYVGIGAALAASSWTYFRPFAAPLDTQTHSAPAERSPRIGVLLVNLGTPDAPTTAAVKRFLREFLCDPRVVELPRALWWVILNLFVLPYRSPRVAESYQKIWGPEGSPLLTYGKRVVEQLRTRLDERHEVVLAMRYGSPSLSEGVTRLASAGCEQIVAVPLFPQQSNSTTGSIQAALGRIIEKRRDGPALRVIAPYYAHPAYIKAVAACVHEATGGDAPQKIIFSFHGLPESYVRGGDPYLDQCDRTAWALARELGLEKDRWQMVFQSRFGKEPWLAPNIDEVVPALAAKYPRLAVVMPGFAADCLETLEEVGIRLRSAFMAEGGEQLIVVPALNDSPQWVDALATLVAGSAAQGSARDARPHADPPDSGPDSGPGSSPSW